MVIFVSVNGFEHRTGFMIEYLRYAKGLAASMSRLFTGWFQKTILSGSKDEVSEADFEQDDITSSGTWVL